MIDDNDSMNISWRLNENRSTTRVSEQKNGFIDIVQWKTNCYSTRLDNFDNFDNFDN